MACDLLPLHIVLSLQIVFSLQTKFVTCWGGGGGERGRSYALPALWISNSVICDIPHVSLSFLENPDQPRGVPAPDWRADAILWDPGDCDHQGAVRQAMAGGRQVPCVPWQVDERTSAAGQCRGGGRGGKIKTGYRTYSSVKPGMGGQCYERPPVLKCHIPPQVLYFNILVIEPVTKEHLLMETHFNGQWSGSTVQCKTTLKIRPHPKLTLLMGWLKRITCYWYIQSWLWMVLLPWSSIVIDLYYWPIAAHL